MDTIGKFFEHKNGSRYQLKYKCQTQIEGVWFNFVVYENKDGELFSRSEESFFGGNFKIIEKNSW